MSKYYRVLKDTFIWKEGAILEYSPMLGGYTPIEDIWNTTPVNEGEYISSRIVEHENNTDTFERVYRDTLKDTVFRTAEQLKESFKKSFKN